MRFMMIVKGNKDSEAGRMPTEQELTEMTAYNEELVAAGAMLAGEGLHPSSNGVRIRYSGKEREVVEGPFSNPEQMSAGYWIIDVESREQAIEWARRVPFQEGEVELRQVFEEAEFGEELTPELREKEARMRSQIASKQP